MKTLVYKIHKVEKNGNSELITKGGENEIREKWESIEPGEDHELSVGWELNGKLLGVTLLEWK